MPTNPEPLNIVILGASFAGCAAAHQFLSQVVPTLGTTADAPRYRLVLISPSTHIYWNIGAPRILVSEKLIPYEDAFVAIEPGFERYGKSNFTFIQAAATNLDTENHLITLSFTGNDGKENDTASRRATIVSGKRNSQGTQSPRSQQYHRKSESTGSPANNRPSQTIPYHALILATGSSTFSPLYTLQGPHEKTQTALDTVHRRIPSATNIVIVGGGATGVETAGALATFYRSKLAFASSKLSRRNWTALGKKRHITLISATSGLLPSVDSALGRRAEKQLRGLGIKILHNTRVVSAFTNDGSDSNQPPKGSHVRTTLSLSNGTTLDDIDLYIPCTGVHPNTAYLPPVFRSEDGYANTDTTPLTLRLVPRLPDPTDPHHASSPSHLPRADRVYAVGDCASYSANYVLDVYDAIPVLMHNLTNDLLAWELREAQPYGGNEDEIAAIESSDAVFQGRRAKPVKPREKKEKREGPKRLRKCMARMTLMTPFLDLKGREVGEGGDNDKSKTVSFAVGKGSNRMSTMSLSEAIKIAEPDRGKASQALPQPIVDKSRWSGLSEKGKEKANPEEYGAPPLSPRRGGIADTCEYDPSAPHQSSPAPANMKTEYSPVPPSTATTRGSPNHGSPEGDKASQDQEEVERVLIDTQICPITRFGGVGIVFGIRIPSLMVWALKGRDYRVGKGRAVVWNGNNPY